MIEAEALAGGSDDRTVHVAPPFPPHADIVVITDEGFNQAELKAWFAMITPLGYSVKHVTLKRQGH